MSDSLADLLPLLSKAVRTVAFSRKRTPAEADALYSEALARLLEGDGELLRTMTKRGGKIYQNLLMVVSAVDRDTHEREIGHWRPAFHRART